MRTPSEVGLPMTRGHTRNFSIAGGVALLALLMAACSSGTNASSSSGSSSSATPASTSASATASLPSCPSASVVNAALGQSDTGPVVTGTSIYEICTYSGSGPVPTKVSISENTPAGFKTDEQSVASGHITLSTVPGLGDENYLVAGVGEVFALKGSTQVEVMAPGTTDAQVEALARQLI